MVGTTGSTYWAEHGRETSAPQNSLLSRVVSSPPRSHSDLPAPYPALAASSGDIPWEGPPCQL